jgi:hypothetical protein
MALACGEMSLSGSCFQCGTPATQHRPWNELDTVSQPSVIGKFRTHNVQNDSLSVGLPAESRQIFQRLLGSPLGVYGIQTALYPFAVECLLLAQIPSAGVVGDRSRNGKA